LASAATTNFSSRYLDTSGTSSRAALVTPPIINGPEMPTYRRVNSSQNISTSQFANNMERYQRESRSEYDLHHGSVPYRTRTTMTNVSYRPYGTIDYGSNVHRRRSLPKSFSDCNLCKREYFNEECQQYYDENDNNWHLESTLERRGGGEPRSYRERIKERFRERLTVRKIPDTDIYPPPPPPPPTTTVEYSTVLPRHQRHASESNRAVQHLPFEYIPNDNVRTVEYKRNSNQERVTIGNNHQRGMNDENGTTNFTVKFYEHDDDDEMDNRIDRCLHEAREVQEMSMRMSEQQNFNGQQRLYIGNTDI
jgi:hypothetical protein